MMTHAHNMAATVAAAALMAGPALPEGTLNIYN